MTDVAQFWKRDNLKNAARRLAEARVRYSREFQLAKMTNPGMTDKHAMFIADEATKSEITELEVELAIARKEALG